MNKTLFADPITDQGGPVPASASVADPIGGETPPILVQYWGIALRWKYLLLGVLAAALAIGLVVTLLATPQYTAKAQIEISRDAKNPTNVEGVESEKGSQDLEFYQTQYTLLESRSLAERVARQLNLGNNQAFYTAHGIDSLPGGAAADRVRSAAGLLRSHIEVAPISRSRLVDISYESGSPEMSARIANSWVQNYVQATMDRRFASTTDARAFLEGRLAELARKLEDSERLSANFAAEKGIVPLTESRGADGKTETTQTLVSQQLEALSNELARATADRMASEATSRGPVNAGTVSNPTVTALRTRRAELASDYAKLLEQFEPGYPTVQALKSQIATIDASIASEEGRVNASRGTSAGEASRREAALRGKVDELTGRLGQQSRDQIQYNIYRRDADTTRQLYDSLLQRYKEIGVAGVAANNIAVVDPAEVPNSPTSPSLAKNLLVALILGVLAGVLAVIALEQIDEGLRQPADVRRLLQQPLLGVTPSEPEANPLALLSDPKSHLSEAYLSIQSNLAFTTDHGFPKSVLVTSSQPGEGKSVTALALATMLTRTGKKAILIDADMRSPSQTEFAGIDNSRGLSNFLAGDNDVGALLRPLGDGALRLMPAGPLPPSAAELLSSDRMAQLVDALHRDFDHVVIDAPPLLGLADAPLLSRAVEGCVFVVEANSVAVRGLRGALARLQQAHAHIFGVVLTKLEQTRTGYGYGYGYGYGQQAKS